MPSTTDYASFSTRRAVVWGTVIALMAGGGAAAGYEPPRTSDGVPDLQGTWTSATLTTLERPAGIEGLVLTSEQAAAWETRTGAAVNEDALPTDPDEGAPAEGANVGGYNRFWLDPGGRLAVVDGEPRSSLVVEPADGRVPYTNAGRSRLAALAGRSQSMDGPEPRQLGDRCIVGYGSTGGPPMIPVLYNNNYQIVQAPGYLMILVEMNHDARIVRIGGEHLPHHMRPWLGDSIGWWEGNTLVVETKNLRPDQEYRPEIRHVLYVPASATVTERFTRVADDEILYEFTVEDPDAYTQAWRAEIPLRATQSLIYEYACHEGNYALPGILGGARAAERAAAAR